MFGIIKPQKLIQTVSSVPSIYTNLQTVRWRRKPRWFPVAKSKIFRVPPRTQTPLEEKVELQRLYNNYHNQIKSIRSYLHNQYNVKSVIIDTEAHEKEFLKEFETSCIINNEWNEEVKKIREVHHEKELNKNFEITMDRLDAYNAIRKNKLETVEEIVRREKEASKKFITTENIDAAIQNAVNNPVDYNYSIDLHGNVYYTKTKLDVKTNAVNQ